jgi:hypothetical protein
MKRLANTRLGRAIVGIAAAVGFIAATALPASATITSFYVQSCVSGWQFKVTWVENNSARYVRAYAPGAVLQATATGSGTKWYYSNTYPANANEYRTSDNYQTQTRFPEDRTYQLVNC